MTSKSERRLFQTICRLSPSQPHRTTTTCVKVKEGKDVLVISSGNNLVHLIQGNKIIGIIDVYSPVIKVLDCCDVKEHVLVITIDGKLWAVSVQTKKQEKCSLDTKMEIGDTDFDILDDLLGTGDSTPHKTITSSTHVTQCSDHSIVHWQQGLCNAALNTNHLVTYAKTSELTLSVYERRESHYQPSISDIDKPLLLSPVQYRIKLNSGPQLSDTLTDNDKVTALLCLEPGGESHSQKVYSKIDQQLFHLLFQTEMGSKVPVVLIGRESGAVGYISLGVNDPGVEVPIEMLCHLEQSVVAVFGACLTKSNSGVNKISDTLVLVGALGKVVFIRVQDPGRTHPRGIQFQEYNIPGPIVCSAVSSRSDIWFYSTLKEVYYVQFSSFIQSHEERIETSACLPLSLSPGALHVPKVCGLVFEESCINSKGISLLCIKIDGRVLLLERSLDNILSSEPNVRAGLQSGNTIKQYLEEIQKKSDTAQCLDNEIRELDDIIQQLNVTTHLFCEVLRSHQHPPVHGPCQDCGIRFVVDISYELQGNCKPCVILKCELVNSTKFTFSAGWSLVVQVRTRQPWYNEDCQTLMTLNHSVPLGHSPSHHLSIPLESTVTFLSPIEVSCYIHYHMKDLVPEKFNESELGHDRGFTVLVQNVKLNILNFLRTGESNSTNYDNSQYELFQKTLKSFNSGCQTINQPSKATQSSSFLIQLSQEAVLFIKKFVCEHELVENDLVEAISEEQCVLVFLLFNSMRQLHWEKVQGNNFIVVQTPNGDEVRFQVVRLVQGTFGTDGGCEVRVFMSSEALKCSIHSALLDKLKPVLHRDSEIKSKIPLAHLQRHLTKLKNIQASLDLLREPHALTEDNADGDLRSQDALEKVITIYRELREIPTLIF